MTQNQHTTNENVGNESEIEGSDENGLGPRIGDDQLIARLHSATNGDGKPPVLSTKDIAELLPIGQEATRQRLNDLEVEKRVRKYKAGRNPVWWPASGEEGGEIRGGGINIKDLHLNEDDYRRLIDPAEVPTDVAQKIALNHGYLQTDNWLKGASLGKSAGLFGFGLMLLTVLTSQFGWSFNQFLFTVLVTVGFTIAIIGLIIWSVGLAGYTFENRSSYYEQVSKLYKKIRTSIR